MFSFSKDAFQSAGENIVFKEKRVCLISPSDFLLLTLPEPEIREKARYVYKQGLEFNTLPVLKAAHEEDALGWVAWSNGRHRCRVLRKHYWPAMPVLLYLYRHRTDTQIMHMNGTRVLYRIRIYSPMQVELPKDCLLSS